MTPTAQHPTPNTVSTRIIKNELVDWSALKYIQQENFKDWTLEAKQKLKTSIIQNQFAQPFYVWKDPASGDIYCLDGRHRTLIMQELVKEGYEIPALLDAIFIDCKDKKEAARMVLLYSSVYAKITENGLFDFAKMYELDFSDLNEGFELPDMDMSHMLGAREENDIPDIIPQSLSEKFIVPPFSILDTRQGYWQERKKVWHSLFNSQESREDTELIAKSGQSSAVYELRNRMRKATGVDPEWDDIIAEAKKQGLHIYEGASIFDPVLAEICYKWFCTEGGAILDPFAGGSVRGIVAGLTGFKYCGIDLREDQVKANHKQWSEVPQNKDSFVNVGWFTGDSNIVLESMSGQYDFVFSCPPYHDLEKYSEDPADLSNMNYEDFLKVYTEIIQKSVSKLKDDRFACFVVGDIRDREGIYRNFVSKTISAFQDAGMNLYNEIILINVAGSLPIRVGRQFEAGRKVGKMHQNVLVFYKGDPKNIRANYPEIKVDEFFEKENKEVVML